MSRNNEKDFLHDISSPVSVLVGGLEMLRSKIQSGKISDLHEVELRVDKLLKVSDRLTKLLIERKDSIKSDN